MFWADAGNIDPEAVEDSTFFRMPGLDDEVLKARKREAAICQARQRLDELGAGARGRINV